ncbi:MAG: copper resistance protein CopC [Actinomycetota bacterium]|nr:copper resistance protein CopC [Actinomycetota bacterium]
MSVPRARFATAALLAVLSAVFALLAAPGTALAHASLVASTPAANSVLEDPPAEIVLDFDEAIEGQLASIRVFDASGSAVELGAPAEGADDSIVRAAVPSLGDGIYAVVWRVTSADGHVVDGAFSFQVGTAATGDGQELIDRVRGGARADASVRWWHGVARFLSLIGAIVLLGAGGWALVGPAPLLAGGRAGGLAEGHAESPAGGRADGQVAGGHVGRRVGRLLVAAAAALLVGSAATFGLFGAEAVAGGLGDAFTPSLWGDVAGTETGRMLLVRTGLALLLAGLLALRGHRREGWWRSSAFTAALFVLYTFPAAGHPSGLDPAAPWIAVDLLHLAAISVWIGGLALLAIAGRAALAEPDGDRLVRRFSLVATISVPLIVATGVAQTLKLGDGLSTIADTEWGQLLLTKVAVVAALLAVAAASRWLLRNGVAGSVHRTMVGEAVLGLVVVGFAAGVVALPPEPPVASRPFAEQLAADGLIAIVSLSPGSVGSGNEMHLVMTPPGGSIEPIVSASARVSLPSAGLPNSPIELVREGANHYSGAVTFPRAGEWTLEIVVQITDTEQVLLKTTVPIP